MLRDGKALLSPRGLGQVTSQDRPHSRRRTQKQRGPTVSRQRAPRQQEATAPFLAGCGIPPAMVMTASPLLPANRCAPSWWG